MKTRTLLLLSALILGGSLVAWRSLNLQFERRAPAGAETVSLLVPPGTPVTIVGRMLAENQLIGSLVQFRLYCKLHGCELQAGLFELPRGAGIAQLVEMLRRGDAATRTVTIPEGRASWEIFHILHQAYPELDSLRWENRVHDSAFAAGLGVPGGSLEGYLFPDTYNLPWDTTEDELLMILVHHFFDTWESLPREDSPVFRDHGLKGTVTLASIIEEETAAEIERTRIAGVFWNRVQRGMPLGADPTVRFIYRSLTGPIYKSQLDSNSPYNTRKFTGLPPGPISNPGRASLKAALQPAKTPDLYFVAKENGTREHFFATNLQDHNKFRESAAANRTGAAMGTGVGTALEMGTGLGTGNAQTTRAK